MKKTFVSIIFVFITNLLLAQIKVDCSIDCVQLSNIDYLIIIKNNTDRSLYLPATPNIQKCNDTLFVTEKFSYQHYMSTTHRYTIDGITFDTNAPLNDYIKPDTVFKKSEGYIPNFAVPSSLIEVKSQSKYVFRVSNSMNQQPRVMCLNIFFKKRISKENQTEILAKIIPAVLPK